MKKNVFRGDPIIGKLMIGAYSVLAALQIGVLSAQTISTNFPKLIEKINSSLERSWEATPEKTKAELTDIAILGQNMGIIQGAEARGDGLWSNERYTEAIQAYESALPFFPTNSLGGRRMLAEYTQKLNYFKGRLN